MKVKYIRYAYPGLIVAEISEWEPLPETIVPPQNADGYQTMEREEETVNGKLLKGDIENLSDWHYVNGEYIPLEEIPNRFPGEKYRTLRDNAQFNNYKGIYYTQHGQAFPVWK